MVPGLSLPQDSKIERGQAVSNFDAILSASDGIMVARGDLGADILLERVPRFRRRPPSASTRYRQ